MRKKKLTKISTIDKGKIGLSLINEENQINHQLMSPKNNKIDNHAFLNNKRKKTTKVEKSIINHCEVDVKAKTYKNFSFNFLPYSEFNQILIENDDLKIFKDPSKIKKIKFDSFKDEYFKFLEYNECCIIKQKISFISENLSNIFELYEFIKENKGFKEMIALGLFEKFSKDKQIFKNGRESRLICDEYLFHFLEFEEGITQFPNKPVQEILKEIFKYDPSYVCEVPIIYAPEDSSLISKKITESFKQDLVILRGFLPKFDLDNKYLNKDYLLKYHAKKKVDIIEQDPKFEGFTTNKHIRKSMLLKDYIEYIKMHESNPSSSNTNLIKYAVNIDLDDYEEIRKDIEQKLDPLIMCGSKFDLLSYLRQNINGMTCGQMYLKVKGVWTGGHEENLRFRSINVNHGPGISDWFGVPYEYSSKFREIVKNIEHIDIYTKEGIWFVDLKYFMEHKIKVFYGAQVSGDIILVGAGCLHWVRARGHSINSSWNIGSKDKLQIQYSIERYLINKEIKFKSLVPMLTLLLDFLNNELNSLELEIVEYCQKFLKGAQELSLKSLSDFQKLKFVDKERIFKEPEHYVINSCEICYEEIFNYWAFCNSCSEKSNTQAKIIFCLNCIKKHLKDCKDKRKIDLIYKYEEKDLRKFFERIETRIIKNSEISKNNSLKKNHPQKELSKTRNDKNFEFKYFREVENEFKSFSLDKANEYFPPDKISMNLLPLIDNDFDKNSMNIKLLEDYVDISCIEGHNVTEFEEQLKFSPLYERNYSEMKENLDFNTNFLLEHDLFKKYK